MEQDTHQAVDPGLCGRPSELAPGRAVVEFEALESMRADASGLVHGGFVFGLADYAAMLAVNHPHVVLGAAQVRFSAPVVVGDRLTAVATAQPVDGSKRPVEVEVTRGGQSVFSGTFVCFTPSRHVLEPRR
jgi:acyl-coenzyme A thioesterase PaaI-like protein